MQLSNQECDWTLDPFSTVHRFILTPSSTTTPAPMVTFGPMVQFCPICAVGSCGGEFRTGAVMSIYSYFTNSATKLRSPPGRCRGNRAPCAASLGRVAVATEGTDTSPWGSLSVDRCPSRNLQNQARSQRIKSRSCYHGNKQVPPNDPQQVNYRLKMSLSLLPPQPNLYE